MHIFRGNIIFLSHLNLSGQLPELYVPVEETHGCSRCKRCSFVASIPPLLILHVIMKNRCSQGPLKLWFHVLKPWISFQNFVSLNFTTGIDLDMAVYFLTRLLACKNTCCSLSWSASPPPHPKNQTASCFWAEQKHKWTAEVGWCSTSTQHISGWLIYRDSAHNGCPGAYKDF